MENMFKDAYFGKAYKTKDGRKAIYFHQITGWHNLIVENEAISLSYQDSGLRVGQRINDSEWPEDIVSEWQEEVNEERLHKLALEYAENNDTLHPGCAAFCAYKAGYRKAKEE